MMASAATQPPKKREAKPTRDSATKRAPRGSMRAKVVEYLRTNPGARSLEIEQLIGHKPGAMLQTLLDHGIVKRAGKRGSYAYSLAPRRGRPPKTTPTARTPRSKPARTTSTRPALERAKRLQKALAQYVELQERADAALAKYEAIAREAA